MTAYYYKKQGDYNYIKVVEDNSNYKHSMINAVRYYTINIK